MIITHEMYERMSQDERDNITKTRKNNDQQVKDLIADAGQKTLDFLKAQLDRVADSPLTIPHDIHQFMFMVAVNLAANLLAEFCLDARQNPGRVLTEFTDKLVDETYKKIKEFISENKTCH